MRTVLILGLCFLAACGSNQKVPDGILNQPQMTNVLWDLMLADELIAQTLPADTGTIRFDTSMVLYGQIAQAHNTTQAQFKKSLNYYKTRPDLMKVILDTLNNRTILPPPPKTDSLVAQ